MGAEQSPTVDVVDLHSATAARPRILMVQPNWIPAHSSGPRLPAFDIGSRQIEKAVETSLNIAKNNGCTAVVFPELLIPHAFLPRLVQMVSESEIILIGGSHYIPSGTQVVNTCPIIYNGRLYLSEKIQPAPAEISPVIGKGVKGGRKIFTFTNSPIGTFSVLICSDFLASEVKGAAISEDIDVLFVIALQRNSDRYYQRLDLDVENSDRGFYAFYCNSFANGLSDGRSAVFSTIDDMYKADLVEYGFINQRSPYRSLVAYINDVSNFLIVEVDLLHKRPTMPRTVRTNPNVLVVERGFEAALSGPAAQHGPAPLEDDFAMTDGPSASTTPDNGAHRLWVLFCGVLETLFDLDEREFFDDLSARFGEMLWLRGDYRGLHALGDVVETAAVRNGNSRRLAEVLIDYRGWMLASRGELSGGQANILRGLAIGEEIRDADIVSRAHRHLAGIDLINGETRSSFRRLASAYQATKRITSEAARTRHLAPLFYGFAEFFLRTGRLPSGARAHNIAKCFYAAVGDPSKAVKLSVQDGLLAEVAQRFDEALAKYGEALQLAKLHKRADDTIRSLEGISRIYSQLNDLEKADKYRKEAAEWRQRTPILVS